MNLKRIIFAGISTALLTGASLSSAWACGHGVQHDEAIIGELLAETGPSAPTKSTIIQADLAFQRGDFTNALRHALGAYPELKGHKTSYKTTEDAELKRGAKIAAIATVRLKGQIDLKKSPGKVTTHKATINKNLKWATDALATLQTQNADDPELKGYYAESLALNAKTAPEALAILSDLYKRDLLVDAYGFAALAKLSADAKDDATAKVAAQRCLDISSNNALCGVKTTKAGEKQVSVRVERDKSQDDLKALLRQ